MIVPLIKEVSQKIKLQSTAKTPTLINVCWCFFPLKFWSRCRILYCCPSVRPIFFSLNAKKNYDNLSAFGSQRHGQYILETTLAPPRFQFRPHTSWQSETEDHFHVPWQFSVFSLALEGWLLASFVNAFIQESNNFSHCKLHFLQLDLTKLNIDTVKKRFGAIFSFLVKIQTFPMKTPDWFKNDIMIFFFSSLLLQTLSSSMSL